MGLVGEPRAGRYRAPCGGKIRLGVVVFLALVASAGYLGTKFIPPYWAYLSMYDPVKEAAMAAAVRRQDDVKVRASLIERAREEGIALTDEDIEFTRNGTVLALRVSWVVPVDLPRYRYDLRFQIVETALLP